MLVHSPRATAVSKRLSPASSVFAFSRVDETDETDFPQQTAPGSSAGSTGPRSSYWPSPHWASVSLSTVLGEGANRRCRRCRRGPPFGNVAGRPRPCPGIGLRDFDLPGELSTLAVR
jgi:hypothetical protein